MDIKEIIFEIIAEGAEPPIKDKTKLTLKSSLTDDLGYDSLGFIELIVLIEDRFGICIEDNHLLISNLSTPEKIIELIESEIENAS